MRGYGRTVMVAEREKGERTSEIIPTSSYSVVSSYISETYNCTEGFVINIGFITDGK